MNTITKTTTMGKATAKQRRNDPTPAPAESLEIPFQVWPRNLEVAKALTSHRMRLYDENLNKGIAFEGSVDDSLNQLIWQGALRVRDLLKHNRRIEDTLESLRNTARRMLDDPESKEFPDCERPGIFRLLAYFEEEAAARRRVSLAVTQGDKHDDVGSHEP